MKLLIADDEYLIREALSVRLKKGNYEFEQIFYAESGVEAYHIIKEMKPEIVITDVRMEYMSGLELLKKCRQEDISASFIMISGFAEFDYMQEAMEYGACGYLLKPITQEKLFGAMDRAIYKQNEFNRLSMTLKENEQLFLTNLVMKCCQDIITDSEYALLMKQLGAECGDEFIGAAVHVSTYRQDRFVNPEDVWRSLEQFLNARPLPSFKMLPYKKAQNCFFVFMGNDVRDKESEVQAAWHELVGKLKSNGAVITVGLSKPCEKINTDFMLSCERALNQRFERGIGDVYSCRAIRETADISQVLDIPSFELQIRDKEGEEAAAEFEKLVSKLYPHIYNLEFLFQYLFDLMLRVGFNPDKKFWVNYIENKSWNYYKDLNEILESIREELRIACTRYSEEEQALNERVKGYIHKHFREDLSLSILAKQFHLNSRYFASVFKKSEGISPTDYLTQVRIEEAKRALDSTDTPASEIAAMVGYEDPRYFYKVFKKQTGVTPKEWRNKHR